VLEATPPELVRAAAAAGFDAVGVRLTTPVRIGTPTHDLLADRALRGATLAALRETGLRVLDVEFLRFEPDEADPLPAGFLDVAAELGASEILVMSMEPDAARNADLLGALGAAAAPYGLAVNLEFAVYTGVRTLADATAIVAACAAPNAGVLVDVEHFSRSGGQPADLEGLPPHWFRYVQLCDVRAAAPTTLDDLLTEVRTDRLLPGEGVFPLVELLGRLPPALPLAVEAPTRGTAGWSVADRARAAFAALAGLRP
jgi:sugar phosphate isomerase/epimerase